MEVSRLAPITRMVEEGMGVGILPLESVTEEVAKCTLVRWWIEGAHINYQLGFARLIDAYASPIHLRFLDLCRQHIPSNAMSKMYSTPKREPECSRFRAQELDQAKRPAKIFQQSADSRARRAHLHHDAEAARRFDPRMGLRRLTIRASANEFGKE